MSSYTPRQRETFLKRFRIWAHVANRAHMEQEGQGSRAAPDDDGAEEQLCWGVKG